MQIKDFMKNDYNFVNEVKGCQWEGRKCGRRGFEMREDNHICIRGVGSPWDEVLIGKRGFGEVYCSVPMSLSWRKRCSEVERQSNLMKFE